MPLLFKPIRASLWLCVFLFSTPLATAEPVAAAPNVVVSIRPLHALVAAVMQDVAQPRLLLASTQSPHHASLRPSDMRALNQADLVFWIGPQLESFLPRVLRGLGAGTKSVAMIDNPALKLLPLRSTLSHEEHPASSTTDPHIWLSSRNADLMVTQIAEQLSKLDPAHAATYLRNSTQLHQDIANLRQQLSHSDTADRTYLSYHDGYQYFEEEFGLHHAGSVSLNEELQPSAYHIRELRQIIAQQNIHCLVYDAPQRPALIATLLQGTAAQAVELDALGLRQAADRLSWFELIRSLAHDFSACLGHTKPDKLN